MRVPFQPEQLCQPLYCCSSASRQQKPFLLFLLPPNNTHTYKHPPLPFHPLVPEAQTIVKMCHRNMPPGPDCSPPLWVSSCVPGTLPSMWPLLEHHPPFSFTESGWRKASLPSHESAMRCRVVAKGIDSGLDLKPGSALTCYVTVNKSPNLAEPQFPHVYSGWFWWSKDRCHRKQLAQLQ